MDKRTKAYKAKAKASAEALARWEAHRAANPPKSPDECLLDAIFAVKGKGKG